jgi:type IV pilus assembly protein PilQ
MMSRLTLALLVLVAHRAPAPPAPPPDTARVTGLQLQWYAGHAELSIRIDGGPVRWDDFALADPARVVIDLAGARSSLDAWEYWGIDRGGVRRIRLAQPQSGAVRIAVELDRAAAHTVTALPDGLRLRLAHPAGFAPWGVGAPPAAAIVEPRAPPGLRPGPNRPRITATFMDADIRDVLASFAEFADRSIVPGVGVSGTVNAEIRDQPWDVALEAILGAHRLAARELPSGIIRVDALERLREHEEQEPLVNVTHRINYVPAQELVTSLEPLRSARGSIVANPSTNTLVVTDVAAVAERIAAMIRQLDVRTQQVAIQARIVFVHRSRVEELGVTYDLKDTRGNQLNRLTPGLDPATREMVPLGTDVVVLGGTSIGALGNAHARILGPSLEVMLSLLRGRFSLIAFLEALRRLDLSDVQAEPLITTLDNQEAEIWVGERTPIRVVDVGAGGVISPIGQAPRATAQLVETGIRLRVIPTITGDRRVLLQLHAERSSAMPAPGEIGVIFQTQQGTTRLLVNDGQTAVIGGLTVSEVFRRRTGIPLLMELPLLGSLFRTTQTLEQKRDLLILVTPHIVDDAPVP